MKIAYLIDRESIGGGMEYIRRKMYEHAEDDTCVLFSDKGECTAEHVNDWGADEVVVNHLRALVQLFRNPFAHVRAHVTFVVHGIHLRKYDFLPRTLSNVLRRFLRVSLERVLYRRCSRIVVLTATDAVDVHRIYGRCLNVEIEPNTLAGWQFSPAEGVPEGVAGPFEYVFIGRFDFQKGQDLWLEHVVEHQEEMRLRRGRTLFIGDGSTLEACRRFCSRYGIDDLVAFAGAVPNAERYLKCAQTVVSTSRWEGMPYLLMKAVAVGCRIVATDCPGNSDVLAGYDGWTVFHLKKGQVSGEHADSGKELRR